MVGILATAKNSPRAYSLVSVSQTFYAPPPGNKFARFTRPFPLFSRIEAEIKIRQAFCLPLESGLTDLTIDHRTTGNSSPIADVPSNSAKTLGRKLAC